ncbi:MAG: molybdenum cofactor biosynthesis protein MoaE [Candidatus Limnocylindrales bacterium]
MDAPLHVRVRLFALQRQQLGRRDVALELPPGATIEQAWTRLAEAHPVLGPARPSMRFARNGEYADPATVLADGDEVACIPPVAGGADGDTGAADGSSGEADGRRVRRLALGPAPIGDAEVNEMRAAVASPGDGAVVVFLGQTRTSPGTPAPGQEAEAARFAGQEVVGLEYEAYEGMALALLGRIADEIEMRFGVRRLAILHRTGPVAVGEASVAIVVAAPHRESAFEACRYALEELKARVPIWKAERFADGSVWLGAPPREGPTA